MKHLNQFITEYIIKKKLNKPIDSEDHYEYTPKTKKELVNIIKTLLDKGETNLNCIDTSEITDMSFLSSNFDVTNNINVSKWNVSNVINMHKMFYDYENFDCDLSNWDVSKVEDMSRMFENCENFDCDLSNWDVSNVKDMHTMFKGCKKFKGE